MNLIKTKSFELALYTKGDPTSSQIAIVIPGRLDTKDYIHNTSLVDSLAELGYFALSFDPPGTWESSGNIDLYTTTSYLEAINELIEYFGNKPTLLLGHSRGGTVATLAAASNPLVNGVVTIMASIGAPTAPTEEAIKLGFQVSHRDLPPGTIESKEQKTFSLPIAYFTDGEKYNPIEALKKITAPKLLIYSPQDEFTDPEAVKEIFKSLSEPKKLHAINYEHDYRLFPDAISEVNQIVSEFAKKGLY